MFVWHSSKVRRARIYRMNNGSIDNCLRSINSTNRHSLRLLPLDKIQLFQMSESEFSRITQKSFSLSILSAGFFISMEYEHQNSNWVVSAKREILLKVKEKKSFIIACLYFNFLAAKREGFHGYSWNFHHSDETLFIHVNFRRINECWVLIIQVFNENQ